MRDSGPPKLDALKAYITKRVDKARPEWIPLQAMMRKLRALGYTG
jgi:transposase